MCRRWPVQRTGYWGQVFLVTHFAQVACAEDDGLPFERAQHLAADTKSGLETRREAAMTRA